ncbi:MAG: hypothetical protein M1828_000192 [Chrysothrix sp. TS-e1954]|nr:MAG: hypothetical protein M1828_000192 [Chrysothrix sp. TS-e1954]
MVSHLRTRFRMSDRDTLDSLASEPAICEKITSSMRAICTKVGPEVIPLRSWTPLDKIQALLSTESFDLHEMCPQNSEEDMLYPSANWVSKSQSDHCVPLIVPNIHCDAPNEDMPRGGIIAFPDARGLAEAASVE